jgi:hypothetical protein
MIGLSGRNSQLSSITTEVRVDVGAGRRPQRGSLPSGVRLLHFRCNFQRKIQMIKAADTMESDGETVVLSPPAKREGETEAINPKNRKSRKIADLRMTSEELIQMRSKITKSLTVWFEFVRMILALIEHLSLSTFRMQFVE